MLYYRRFYATAVPKEYIGLEGNVATSVMSHNKLLSLVVQILHVE